MAEQTPLPFAPESSLASTPLPSPTLPHPNAQMGSGLLANSCTRCQEASPDMFIGWTT